MTGPVFAQHDEAVFAAEKVGRSWLALTDAGQYAESWDSAASFFIAAITSEDWVTALANARTPFGATDSRETSSSTYSTTLPGAPDGEYVVLIFNTSFRNKAAAVETVTAMKDLDGQWRVAGYFIR
jgi:hypothetical protein